MKHRRIPSRPAPQLVQDNTPERRAQRAQAERARAFAMLQPQALGLLFPGLRPKGQR